MNSVKHRHANDTLLPPPNSTNVDPLSICRLEYSEGVRAVESCWELSDEDLERVIKNKRIYLVVLGDTHPPLRLDTMAELDRDMEARHNESKTD